jgi:hypothetical protein
MTSLSFRTLCRRAPGSLKLTGALVTVSLLVAACGGSGPAQPPTPAAASTATPIVVPASIQAPAITIVLLGEVARNETAEITIHSVRRSSDEGGETPPEGFRWVLLDISLQHLGQQPLAFETTFVHTDGREHAPAHPPGVSAGLAAPIEPGASLRGEIAFLLDDRTRHGTLIFGLGVATWAIQLSNLPGE